MTGTLAIILARAGSKGVPDKNTMPIAGRPCAAWTIDDAVAARSLDKIVVSSDCPRVRDLADAAGLTFVPRPPSLAADHATVDDAARHALAEADPGERFPDVVILYANVPVRPPTLIDDAVRLLRATGADSVQSFEHAGKHHPWWTVHLDAPSQRVAAFDGGPLFHNTFRRQDLPPALTPSGGVIALRRSALLLHLPDAPPGPHAFLGIDRRGLAHDPGHVVDIDAPIDAVVADALLRRHRPHAVGPPPEPAPKDHVA